MTPTPVTPGDAASMIRAATTRAADALPEIVDRFVKHSIGTGDLNELESVLTVAALADLLRARVEHVLSRHVTGSETLLERLDAHVGERIREARRIAEKREGQPA